MLCDQRDVKVCVVEEKRSPSGRWVFVSFVEKFEESGADVHRDPHDDTFRHTLDTKQRRVSLK